MISGTTPNRLIHEKSPYLLQHAYNPVDWHPWGEEAFAKAREEDKPVFLSIGYSTCYWCHVMEREVFENGEIAQLMNDSLVNIKVDREERPDIDRIYMSAVQAITGSGGWPMSVFLTPDREPFYGGTYIPPKARYGRPGFPDLIGHITELWKNDRAKITESGRKLAEHLRSHSRTRRAAEIDEAVPATTFERLRSNFDPVHAGFGTGPKFPRPVTLSFLLRYHAVEGNAEALDMALATLRHMARGGMYDHVGGGFHRYSVDGQWRVPHFEKMLYDQAQLVVSYAEAYQLTKDESFARIVHDVLRYVTAHLLHSEGGFYSAEDAESAPSSDRPDDKEEGLFYLWTVGEIMELLGPGDGALFCRAYGAEEPGNALHDPLAIFLGKNILYAAKTAAELAAESGRAEREIEDVLASARSSLSRVRDERPRPHLDDKVITAWNGLMISAFAKAHQIFGTPEYRTAAERAASFVLERLFDRGTKTLRRRWRDGEARFEGGLEDYAFLTAGLIDLYEATFDTRWLRAAAELSKLQHARFWDAEGGGFFDTPGTDASLLVRTKEEYDGAEPSGNSVAALNFLRLGTMLDRGAWRDLGAGTVAAFGARLNAMPDAAVLMVTALLWVRTAPAELILAGQADSAPTAAILREIHRTFLPHKVLLLIDDGERRSFFAPFLPFTAAMTTPDGATTLYLCENYACQLPTADPHEVQALLGSRTHQPSGQHP